MFESNQIYPIIFIFFIILVVFLTPLVFFQKIMNALENKFQILTFEIKKILPSSPLKNGQNLLWFMSLLDLDREVIEKRHFESIQSLTPFKFYHSQIILLMNFQKDFGISIKNFLLDLRSNLLKDLQFEKQKNQVKGNAYWQMIAMAGLTYGFIFVVNQQIQLPISWFIILAILSLNFLGASIFLWGSRALEKKYFSQFENLSKILVIIRAHLNTQPNSQVIYELYEKHQEKEGIIHPKWEFLHRRLLLHLIKMRDLGTDISSEISELTDEVWHTQEEEFERFGQHLSFFKFLILVLFFLSGYLLFVLYLFSFFME